jgi:hypothetical protein
MQSYKCLLIPLHPPNMYVGISSLSMKCTHGVVDKLFCWYFRLDDRLNQAQVKLKFSMLGDGHPQRLLLL